MFVSTVESTYISLPPPPLLVFDNDRRHWRNLGGRKGWQMPVSYFVYLMIGFFDSSEFNLLIPTVDLPPPPPAVLLAKLHPMVVGT